MTVPVDGVSAELRRSNEAVFVGITGASRNPATAVAVNGTLESFCEEERLTRIRGTGLSPGALPDESLQTALVLAGCSTSDVAAFVCAEESLVLPSHLPKLRISHHHGHAATAFLSSPFQTATIVICDTNSSPDTSVWTGHGNTVVDVQWPWAGCGFASLFTQCTRLFGLLPGQEHRLEALARCGTDPDVSRAAKLFRYLDGRLVLKPRWQATLADWLSVKGTPWPIEHVASVARSVQAAIGDALLAFVHDVRKRVGGENLCLGGGLFFNTFLNTLLAERGLFDAVHVPQNPGNAGVAAGAALVAGGGYVPRHEAGISSFLGPAFDLEQIKATLDNCKLSVECLPYGEVISSCVEDLAKGRLVGWFQGRMEWGHRALGHRSILANPFSRYVLDNLNVFLKKREAHRSYGLSVCEEDAPRYFEGPPRSRSMEFDYRILDVERFRTVLPLRATTLRVQTIPDGAGLFRELHKAFAASNGCGVLVNTSFNGFSEPIVCSPRDAIRVFFGSGLDVLVLERFVIRK